MWTSLMVRDYPEPTESEYNFDWEEEYWDQQEELYERAKERELFGE